VIFKNFFVFNNEGDCCGGGRREKEEFFLPERTYSCFLGNRQDPFASLIFILYFLLKKISPQRPFP
jgi:hypothetical protein